MYPSLAIPELAERIISYLEPYKDRKSLAALARTARAFYNPAVASLWRSQRSLFNILRCLPPDLYGTYYVQRSSYSRSCVLRLLRPIEVSDWERTRMYANHVRQFSYSPPGCFSLDSFSHSLLYAALAFNFMDDGIFPNLTHLSWDWYDDDYYDFFHIRLFLSPKLTAITIQCGKPAHTAILPSLSQKCPLLKDVVITFHHFAGKLSTAANNNITQFILGLHSVESLTIHIPHTVALLHLAQLSSIKHLGVHGLPDVLSQVDLASIQKPFPSIRRLDIQGPNTVSAIRLLQMCSAVPLVSFRVEMLPSAHSLSFGQSQRTSLTSLEIMDHRYAVFTFGCLRPALDLVNLTNVKIRLNLGSDLNDEAISQMARAWPRLRSLEFQRYEYSGHSRTTLHCLRTLAICCPELEHVHMEFNFGVIPSTKGAPVHSRLRCINVNKSTIPDSIKTMEIAWWISAIFPNVNKVDTSWNTHSNHEKSHYNRWNKVALLIPVVIKFREEAKSWALEESHKQQMCSTRHIM